MDHSQYDEQLVTEIRLAPPAPTVIWGALMVVALCAAGATVWQSQTTAGERLVASSDARDVKRNVAGLVEHSDQLTDRMSKLERGLGELKIAAQASSDITGSVRKVGTVTLAPTEAPGQNFAISLGPDVSVDAVRRRWTALVQRYPQALSKLNARAAKNDGAGGVFDLVAGPFATRPEADRACVTLADQGFACDTTIFAGEPLPRP